MRDATSRSSWRQRLQAWALRRQGPDALPLQLRARRIYILPTRAGWTFALLIGVMFLAGVNYGNGLALLFTFWLAGFALVAMVQTQRTLAGATLQQLVLSPAHVGDAVTLLLTVSGRADTQDLQLATGYDKDAQTGTACTRDADALELLIPATRRGHWRTPTLLLSSTAPFGLFRTWTWLQLDARTLVYPRAHGHLPVPEAAGEQHGTVPQQHGQDEFAWLRDFREGDSPRQVDWKAYARGAPLLVREYHGQGALRHEFDFDALSPLAVEARLSQLTRWIVDADARGENWVLRLPGSPPLAGGGASHRVHCLEHLALHGAPELDP